jgi:hypothetical protein
MYIFSFNIISNDIVLTDFPITLVNEDLNNITREIRRMVKSEFLDFSKQNNIPLVDIILNATILYFGENILEHSMKIPLEKIRETIETLKIL